METIDATAAVPSRSGTGEPRLMQTALPRGVTIRITPRWPGTAYDPDMSEETDKALGEMAEDQRRLVEGLEAEVKEDAEKARGERGLPKRPWWKVWDRA
jgi:hypothetical protein